MTTRFLRGLLATVGSLAATLGLCGCGTLTTMGPGSFSTVVIDAGHGGKDNGARSRAGLMEKNVALDTAQRLRPLLQRAGFRTVMVRSDDTFVELDDRVNIANRYPNGILVSVHYNYSPGGWPAGVETFFWRTDSYGLASRVERRLALRTGLGYRGTTRRVLRLTHNPRIPSILCECGFLSNGREAGLISGPGFRQQVAEGIAEGIIEQHEHGDAGVGTLPNPPRPAVYHEAPARRSYHRHGRGASSSARHSSKRSSSSHHHKHRK